MGIRAVAVYSEADADLPYVAQADQAVRIGPAQPARSYLDGAVPRGAVLRLARDPARAVRGAPLLARLCLHGAHRAQALDRARAAVAAFRVTGPKTNLAFHAELLA